MEKRCLLACSSHSLLSLLSYINQDLLSSGGTTHSKKKVPQMCLMAILIEAFSQLTFPLPRYPWLK